MSLATQNPLEQEGTYPLPEAQLDRFLLEITVGYPDLEAERKMLLATTGTEQAEAHKVMDPEGLMTAQRLVRRIPVGESVVEAILALVRNGRPDSSDIEVVRESIAWGPGPRASQALMLAVRARALLDGRLAPSTDDVLALAKPVLRHRMDLTFAARADGITLDDSDRPPRGLDFLTPWPDRARSYSLRQRPWQEDYRPSWWRPNAWRPRSAKGVHGRRRTGQGETFWQFRPYYAGDAPNAIDWRQTAKSDRVYVRQMEWEAAQSIWLWHDTSPSMDWHSSDDLPTKSSRAKLLLLALSVLLLRAGERVALLGSSGRPLAGQAVMPRLAAQITAEAQTGEDLPPLMPLPRHAHAVFFGDFLAPLEEIENRLGHFRRARLARAYLANSRSGGRDPALQRTDSFRRSEGRGPLAAQPRRASPRRLYRPPEPAAGRPKGLGARLQLDLRSSSLRPPRRGSAVVALHGTRQSRGELAPC